MNKFNKGEKIILNHFNETVTKYKNGHLAVSWGSKESQTIRFRVLTEVGELSGKSILDVGCGTGDFYKFMSENGIFPKKYIGIDINPLMIAMAKKIHPKLKFEVRDLLKNPPKENFDYVLASGIFNIKIPNWEKFTYATLKKMYVLSKIGVGVNFLNLLTPLKKDIKSCYADPLKILKFISTQFTSNLILKQDYKPNDFTIFFYKD